jgi:rhamnosyltransferase
MHTFESNVGIATALNYGFALAAQDEVEFVVTFDQDSQPAEDHVSVLSQTWKTLAQQGVPKVGAIGPSFFDDRGKVVQFPFFQTHGLKVRKIYHQAGCSETLVDVLITSGMLVPVSMWREGLKFRDELFIDLVDSEWCFRATAAGFSNFGCFSVRMRHQCSDAEATKVIGLRLLQYSPMRRYYYFRNSLYVSARSYVPLAHKFRIMMGLVVRLLTMPFIDDAPALSLAYALRGLRDGILGNSGKMER